MLPEIITFNKSVQCRLQEYQILLENIDSPCSDVIEIWASIFEDFTIIGTDWQALWILSEENCQKYDLLFPTAVIVNVNDFNWKELTASISVLAVQEDIVIPSTMDVPVIELHPVKVQDYDETELKNIEDWLDKCRYFFNNLWYSWDAKINVTMMNWCENHLENRLILQNDLKNGVFNKIIVNYLKLLIMEAHNLYSGPSKSFSESDDEKLTAVKRYIRRKIIKTELDLFEKPELREEMILLKTKEWHIKASNEMVDNKEVKFVWMKGSCESLVENLTVLQKLLPDNAAVKVCSSLQEALETSSANDITFLPAGVYAMNKFRSVENGGGIKGFTGENTVVVSDMSLIPRAILFECFGFVELENLVITKPAGIAIQIFDGIIKISRCKIMSENNSTSKGIVVLSGSKLFLEECEIHGFGTAIALQKGTQVSITNSKIHDCNEGIKVTDNTFLTMESVDIWSCSTFGIRMESSEIDSKIPIIGDLSLIEQNKTCKVNFSSVNFNDNKKGNVLMQKIDDVLTLAEVSKNNVSNEIFISDGENSEDSMKDI